MTEEKIRDKYSNMLQTAKFTGSVKNLIEPGIKFTDWEKYGHHRIYINRFEGHASADGIEKTAEIGMIDLKNDSNTWFDIKLLDENIPKENLLILLIKENHKNKIKEE